MSGSYYALDAAYNSLQSQLSSLTAIIDTGSAKLANNQTFTGVNTFTQSPLCTAVQPASNDSSTKIPTTAWVQTAVAPIIRTPQNATNSLTQDQVIDDKGRVVSSNIYNGGYGGAQAPSQYLPIDPLPKYPLLCGVWNNFIQTALLTTTYAYTGYSNHSTLSIRINNLSQYSRLDPIIVRLTISFILESQPIGSPPYPFTNFASWTGNVVIFPSSLRVPSTIDPTIPVANENFVFTFFDLQTNDILVSNSPAVYNPNFLLVGGPPNVPQPIFCPEGRPLWAYNINTSGIAGGNLGLYPFVVDNVNDYAILSVVMKNQYVYSGQPSPYNSSITGELICAGYQPVSNVSFIC